MRPEEIKRLRELLGVSQSIAGKLFGVRANTWSRWELGLLNVHSARIPVLRAALADQERIEAQRQASARANLTQRLRPMVLRKQQLESAIRNTQQKITGLNQTVADTRTKGFSPQESTLRAIQTLSIELQLLRRELETIDRQIDNARFQASVVVFARQRLRNNYLARLESTDAPHMGSPVQRDADPNRGVLFGR